MNQGMMFTKISQLDKKTAMLASEIAKTQMHTFATLKVLEQRQMVVYGKANWFQRMMRKLCGLEEGAVLLAGNYDAAMNVEAKLYAQAMAQVQQEQSKPKIVVPGAPQILKV